MGMMLKIDWTYKIKNKEGEKKKKDIHPVQDPTIYRDFLAKHLVPPGG